MVQLGTTEALQEATSSVFAPLRLSVPPGTPFHAEMAGASVGPMVIASVTTTTPGHVRRPRRLIGSGDRDLVKVTLQRSGNAIVTQGDRQCRGGPGDLIAYDMNRPYQISNLDHVDAIVIGLPRPMLGPDSDSLLRHRTAVPVPSDRGIRSVIATFLHGLADTALTGDDSELHGPGAVRLADTAASLLITAFTGTPLERIELPTGLADQILSYALANLHDPGLSVGSVARRFGISPRYLHTLMRSRDIQFAAWVRHERMKRIRQDLLDPRLANLTAAAIAAGWGVLDPDHLGRGLRAEFGQSAAEIRASASRQLPGVLDHLHRVPPLQARRRPMNADGPGYS